MYSAGWILGILRLRPASELAPALMIDQLLSTASCKELGTEQINFNKEEKINF